MSRFSTDRVLFCCWWRIWQRDNQEEGDKEERKWVGDRCRKQKEEAGGENETWRSRARRMRRMRRKISLPLTSAPPPSQSAATSASYTPVTLNTPTHTHSSPHQHTHTHTHTPAGSLQHQSGSLWFCAALCWTEQKAAGYINDIWGCSASQSLSRRNKIQQFVVSATRCLLMTSQSHVGSCEFIKNNNNSTNRQ